jgi:hypothetical protein
MCPGPVCVRSLQLSFHPEVSFGEPPKISVLYEVFCNTSRAISPIVPGCSRCSSIVMQSHPFEEASAEAAAAMLSEWK